MTSSDVIRINRSDLIWPIGKQGGFRTFCPECHSERRASHQHQKELSVNRTGRVAHCFNCGKTFYIVDPKRDDKKLEREERNHVYNALRVGQRPNTSDMYALSAMWLKYLESRGLTDAELLKSMGLRCRLQKLPGNQGQVEVLCFNYLLFGEVVNCKTRTLDKQFQFTRGGTIIPYNIDAIRDTPTCVICEGEFDCIALTMAGFPTISVPTGAGSKEMTFIDAFYESHFENKSTIYIAADADAAGQGLQRELLRRFSSFKRRIVHFPDDCKDANEVLQKHGIEALQACVVDAEEIVPEGLTSFHDHADEVREIFEHGFPRGLELGIKPFDDLCRFETGRLAIVTGVPGDGKSEFLDYLILRMIMTAQWPVTFFSPENMPISYHLVKLLNKIVGIPFQRGYPHMTPAKYDYATRLVERFVTHIDPQSDVATIDYVLSLAEAEVNSRGIRVLVIDPLNCLESPANSSYDEMHYITTVLNKLRKFAQVHDVLVFLVAHPRKINRGPGEPVRRRAEMNDINGSADFANKADYCLVVHRPRTHEEESDGYVAPPRLGGLVEVNEVQIYVEKVKFRHLGKRGMCRLYFNSQNSRYGADKIVDNDVWRVEQGSGNNC